MSTNFSKKARVALQLTVMGLASYIVCTFAQVIFSPLPNIEGLLWKLLLAAPLLLCIPVIYQRSGNGLVWYGIISLGYLTWLSSGLVMKFDALRLAGFLALLVSFSASLMLLRWRRSE